MRERVMPGAEHIDYRCVLGVKSSIGATWFGSTEDLDTVADWYRNHLPGYEEQSPRKWIRHESDTTWLVVVAAADDLPAGIPPPLRPPARGLRTVIVDSFVFRPDLAERPTLRIRPPFPRAG